MECDGMGWDGVRCGVVGVRCTTYIFCTKFSQFYFHLNEIWNDEMHEIDVELWWQSAYWTAIYAKHFSLVNFCFYSEPSIMDGKLLATVLLLLLHCLLIRSTRFDCVDHNSSSSIIVYEYMLEIEKCDFISMLPSQYKIYLARCCRDCVYSHVKCARQRSRHFCAYSNVNRFMGALHFLGI